MSGSFKLLKALSASKDTFVRPSARLFDNPISRQTIKLFGTWWVAPRIFGCNSFIFFCTFPYCLYITILLIIRCFMVVRRLVIYYDWNNHVELIWEKKNSQKVTNPFRHLNIQTRHHTLHTLSLTMIILKNYHPKKRRWNVTIILRIQYIPFVFEVSYNIITNMFRRTFIL